jgi:ubiquinone/menaquinone biosynthesis C-methylase UbiE
LRGKTELNHNDHVNLLKPAKLPAGSVWADLGAGTGAFTLALRELIGPEAEIHAVDKDRASLNALERAFRRRFGEAGNLHLVAADFSHSVDLPGLDGLLMANSLHFHRDKEGILRHVGTFLKPSGLLLLVEYNVDSGNPWVPYPLSFKTFEALARRAGFGEPRLLATHPSSFLREFYSAAANKAET